MMHTTLNRIWVHGVVTPYWKKLLRGLGKTAADDDPIGYDRILEISGPGYALWCLRAEPQHGHLWCAVAVRCVRTVQHLMKDRCILDVAWAATRTAIWAEMGQILLSAVQAYHADPGKMAVKLDGRGNGAVWDAETWTTAWDTAAWDTAWIADSLQSGGLGVKLVNKECPSA